MNLLILPYRKIDVFFIKKKTMATVRYLKQQNWQSDSLKNKRVPAGVPENTAVFIDANLADGNSDIRIFFHFKLFAIMAKLIEFYPSEQSLR